MGDDFNPDPMAMTKNPAFEPQWANAKNVCRLNMEDIGMAKELGLSPQSLRKNRPSPSQPWKGSVKDWIHELYEKCVGWEESVAVANSESNRSGQRYAFFWRPNCS
jgi:hypothetical protein